MSFSGARTAEILLGTVLGWGGVAVALGVGGGLLAGAMKVQQAKASQAAASHALPHYVAAMPDLRDPLLALATGCRKFSLPAFSALCHKLNAMVEAAIRIENAVPETVAASLMAVGPQMALSVAALLQDYYDACRVNTVRTRDVDMGLKAQPGGAPGGDGRTACVTLEPLNRDMRHAHQVLVAAVDALARTMTASARGKLAAAALARLG
jgi:hypothetical protein